MRYAGNRIGGSNPSPLRHSAGISRRGLAPALGGSVPRLLRQHRVLPVTDLEGLYHSLENEGVLLYEFLGRSARLENRHVTRRR